MAIHFSKEQYAPLRATYRQWWDGELDRPIVPIETHGHPSAVACNGPLLAFPNAWDFSIDPREYVEAFDTAMDSHRWHGEAFPLFRTTAFGPGTMAAFLGCTPQSAPQTVWFHPPRKDMPLNELHFEFDENNPYYRRVHNLFEAALDKYNVPYQKYVDAGYFRIIESKWEDKDGDIHINLKTVVFQKGIEFIRKTVLKSNSYLSNQKVIEDAADKWLNPNLKVYCSCKAE